VIVPASRPSAALTWYGIKWVSKNGRVDLPSSRPKALAAAHGACHTDRVDGDATSVMQPTMNAGQASSIRSSFQPGSALHDTGVYRAGSVGTGGGGAAAGEGVGAAGGSGTVTQPATRTAVAAAKAAGNARQRRRNCSAMVWIFLEALVALVIAVAIVAWTMGPKRKNARRELTDDTDPGGKG
jgi:hypothetical protein